MQQESETVPKFSIRSTTHTQAHQKYKNTSSIFTDRIDRQCHMYKKGNKRDKDTGGTNNNYIKF